MHIPDGYLSPITCVATYAAVMPFWVVAFRRLKRVLHTRMVPLLAVFSAFSFVVMMFNLPLPGGTSGHAVGVAIASIVLGKWAAMVAISIALLIQALFFGDGGITTFAANCLNMAVAGSFVASWTFASIAGKTGAGEARRLFAAGLAGYLALNASALLTAVEFGIQPIFFHDAAGTPLYAPYGLSVAVPAMMIGHLAVAGLAELVLTAGLFAYLLRTQSDALTCAAMVEVSAPACGTKPIARLWYGLGAVVAATPLGLLAEGTAWGEWSVQDFIDDASRLEILRVSDGIALPDAVPAGLRRLSEAWTAPWADYAPSFLHNLSLGYVLSAIVGVGLTLTAWYLIARLLRPVTAARPIERL